MIVLIIPHCSLFSFSASTLSSLSIWILFLKFAIFQIRLKHVNANEAYLTSQYFTVMQWHHLSLQNHPILYFWPIVFYMLQAKVCQDGLFMREYYIFLHSSWDTIHVICTLEQRDAFSCCCYLSLFPVSQSQGILYFFRWKVPFIPLDSILFYLLLFEKANHIRDLS